jgi:hypothetical protein
MGLGILPYLNSCWRCNLPNWTVALSEILTPAKLCPLDGVPTIARRTIGGISSRETARQVCRSLWDARILEFLEAATFVLWCCM